MSEIPEELTARLALIEANLSTINERNRKVERDKLWEVSAARRGFIAFVTFLTVSLVLWLVGSRRPLIEACIPTIGYLLSCLSLPVVRRLWERSAL
jgi:hypothetical protein